MATTRIKEKISKIISSQLPEFIQTDYTTFVAFLESYYEFLEQDQGAFELIQNSRKYSDLDQTTEAFVAYFLKNYAENIPVSVQANKRLLIKKIKDLYESKGSELSFKLLFRLLFNENVSINFPFDFVLRASDGRWEQKVSLRLETLTGDRSLILNKLLRYSVNNVIYETPIIETTNLTNNLTEVFLDSNLLAPTYTLGDVVEVFVGDELIYSGIVRPTTVSYDITQQGTGFKRGQVYNLNYEGGIGTLIRVSNITSNTGISDIRIIDYGYNYPANITIFTSSFDSTKTVSEIPTPLASRIRGFSESGTISYSNATVITSFSSNNIQDIEVTGNTSPDFAVINFTLGSLARYPGIFSTPNGFLSEPDVRLQDDALYQPFAYQTNSAVDITEFFNIVKQLVHPSGQRLFNNRVITSNIDISANVVVSPSSILFLEFIDVFDVSEQAEIRLNKVFFDNVVSLESNFFFNYSTEKSDSTLISENSNITLSKFFDDNLFVNDDAPQVNTTYVLNFTEQRSLDYFQESYISEDYTSVSGFFIKEEFGDNTPRIIEPIELTFNETRADDYFLETYVGATELYTFVNGMFVNDGTFSLSVSKPINNSISNVSISEVATALFQDYTQDTVAFFSEDYTGSSITLT